MMWKKWRRRRWSSGGYERRGVWGLEGGRRGGGGWSDRRGEGKIGGGGGGGGGESGDGRTLDRKLIITHKCLMLP